MPLRSNCHALFLIAVSFSALAIGRAETSKLWGTAGENWSPESRLPDFSFAGYHSSRKPIPASPRSANVKDFGAKGDGETDDTEAFLTAIQTAPNGVLFIPEGKYKITQILRVTRPGIVLEGEGPDRSTLFFPLPLEKAAGPGKHNAPSGSWSWDGGFIWFEGNNGGEHLAQVTAPARRGATTFKVNQTEPFYVGQRVRLIMVNTDGALGRELHAGKAEASKLLIGKTLVDFSCTVTAVGLGEISVDRPIRTDVRPSWKPAFYTDLPSVEDVGIEQLTIAFPMTRYAGHHKEPGYNAILFQGVSNGWVRDVHIVNADCGVIFRSRSKFCTIKRVVLRTDPGRARGAWEGHHGFEVADLSQDNLISEFEITARVLHSISLTSMAAGNVFMKGRGTDLHFDHHRKGPYENLFTEIDAGQGSDLWMSGGDEDAGPHSGARETVWNVTAQKPQSLPDYAIQMNVAGLTGAVSRPFFDLKKYDNWVEGIAPDALVPANLFESQLARRLGKKAR